MTIMSCPKKNQRAIKRRPEPSCGGGGTRPFAIGIVFYFLKSNYLGFPPSLQGRKLIDYDKEDHAIRGDVRSVGLTLTVSVASHSRRGACGGHRSYQIKKAHSDSFSGLA